MGTRYIADWEDRLASHEAWWAREGQDGPLLWVTAPRDEPTEAAPEPAEPPLPGKYLDADYLVRLWRWRLATTYFGGDAFPVADANLGPGSLALYLGAEPGFAEGTIWFEPAVKDLRADPLPRFDPDSRWFRVHLALVRRLREGLGGGCLVAIPDLVESLDILAALRGPTAMLYDLKDCPADCHRWLRRINELYRPHYDAFYEACRDGRGRSTFTAFRLWGRGRVCKVQCDFAAMISPVMFQDVVVPSLQRLCDGLDYTIFHLDGPRQICHLEHLLDMDDLDGIQWVPGSGAAQCESTEWLDLYRRVLERDKLLVLQCISDYGKIPALLDQLPNHGRIALIGGFATEAEGQRFLESIPGR